MQVRVGCAGWGYDDWVGPFYARGTPAGEFLAAYSRVFDAVEVDSTYYRAPSRSHTARWAEVTPKGFLFCPKLPEEIVRTRKLRDVDDLVAQFLEGIEPLRAAGKLGPLVAQTTPGLVADKHGADMRRFLDLVPRAYDLAIEFRNDSWWTSDTYDALRGRGAALVWSWTQYGTTPAERTADWTYARLIGDRELTKFDRIQRDVTPILQDAKSRLVAAASTLSRAFVIANNHVGGFAPATVNMILEALGMTRADLARAARTAGQRGLGEF